LEGRAKRTIDDESQFADFDRIARVQASAAVNFENEYVLRVA
jgi:hypothetical protein